MIGLLLIWFSQITYSMSGVALQTGDVSKMYRPMLLWLGSLLNLLIAFRPVILVIMLIFLFMRFARGKI